MSLRIADAGAQAAVSLRRFPRPFFAMLAISTDIDGTTMEAFRETHRFLNTHEQTSMGRGLGLDVANSFWVYGRGREPSLFWGRSWERDSLMADEVLHYLRSGWIDTLHSYGSFDGGFTREHAQRALDRLRSADVELRVWVNHGGRTNAQNLNGFGIRDRADNKLVVWEGDAPGAPGYHADLMVNYGIRFAWQYGRDAKVFGLDRVSAPWRLADGSRVWGFIRNSAEISSPEAEAFAAREGVVVRQTRGGRRWLQLWHPEYLPRQVDPQKLDQLVAAQQAVVIAQHLGADIGKVQFPLATVDALRILKAYEDDGQVLVASTGRLLRFEQVREHLRLDLFERGAEIVIDMARVVDPLFGEFTPTLEDVRGITLQVDDPGRVELRVGGKRIVEHQLVRSRPTFEEPPSIGVRWFERDVTDYSRSWRR